MNRGSTLFLRVVIALLALGVLTLCVYVLPRIIGSIDLGGYDPILIGMYVPAIPFFIALYQALTLLNLIDRNQAFSLSSVRALRVIKYCGGAISTLYVAGMPYIAMVAEQDDAPGVIAIGLVIIFASFVIAVFAALLQQLLQNAIDIKAENDLTV